MSINFNDALFWPQFENDELFLPQLENKELFFEDILSDVSFPEFDLDLNFTMEVDNNSPNDSNDNTPGNSSNNSNNNCSNDTGNNNTTPQVVDKDQLRKIKNLYSARKSRFKIKEHEKSLKNAVAGLILKNHALSESIKQIHAENDYLMSECLRLKQMASSISENLDLN